MVIVECDLDEYVIQHTGYAKDRIHHVAGKGKVIKKLVRHPDKVGMIDKDPDSPQPHRLKEYIHNTSNGDLELREHQDDRSIKLIIINPRIEGLLNRATVNSIDITVYGYPSNADKLHDIPKIERQDEFKNFITDLFTVDTEFSILKKWVNEYEN